MSKHKQIVIQKMIVNNNEGKFEKIEYSREKQEATWKNFFMLDFLLCE
jgi:hypothetical protein